MVGAPFDASSSGWAWTVSRQSRSFTTVNAIEGTRNLGCTVVRRLVAIPAALAALAIMGSGCRHDGRELRPALPSQDGSVSTSAAPTVPATEDDFFDTAAAGGAVPGGPIEPSTTVLGTVVVSSTIAPVATALTVTAPWRDGAPIDPRYTCKGANVSPPLSWVAAPQGTKEIAVTLIDEDANFDHWTMAGIKPGTTSLAENTPPEGAVAALNGSGAAGYTGPCPPAGTTHTYRITVHYLDTALLLSSGGSAADMRAAIDDATLATAQVTGIFTGT
jgi:Raf kinase inhibitor-like YbhB/YbcL family protein